MGWRSVYWWYIIVPIIVVLALIKLCFILCRAAYQCFKEEEGGGQLVQQQRGVQVTASLRQQKAIPNDYVTITASSRASCPGGGTTATGGGSRATGSDTRPTGCVRPAAGPYTVSNSSGQRHPGFNPNIPPSYDQAVAGKCKSAKLEEGLAEAQGPVAMETVALNDSPPAYTPASVSTSEFPLAAPTPPPIYSSHVSDDSKMDDGDPNKIAVIWTK